jgi:general secretion pathway protein D
MKKYWIIQRIIAIILVIAIITPLALAGGGNKYFKKGRKFEAAEQWDLAAEQYALALSEDPGNPEYKLHLLRSLSRASLTFMERGKTLAEQGDYEGAYQAFRQAYSYDNSNEMALARMKNMLEKLGISNDGPDSFGNDDLKKTSLSSDTNNQKNIALSISKFRPQNFSFRDAPASVVINTIAKQSNLNVVYDDQIVRLIESKKVNFELEGVTAPKALEVFLATQRYAFAPITRRTVVIFQDVALNRQKYEDLLIRTFYIKNAVAKDIAQPLQQALTVPGTGKPIQIIPIDKLNALVVRETKENLALIETMLERLDKAQSEVVMDVNLYEVTDNALVQIGLDSLGGIGQNSIRRISPGGIFDSTLGIALSVPNSTISLLQSKSVGKLVASTQIRAFEGENASVNIGSRVPIRSATIPTGTVVTSGTGQGQNQNQNQFNFPGSVGGVEQITYENVGLNINISKPTVLYDYVQMMFEIESSSVVPDPDPQRRNNPTFTQRKVKGTTRIKEGETSIVTSVMRLDKSEGASGIPILSFIPIAGRFFATPNNSSMSTNIVVTVTPHVLRAPNVSESDLAMLSVNTLTLEQMVATADLLDEQDKEAKAKQDPQQNNPQNDPQRSVSPQNNLPVQGVNNQKPVQPTSNVTRPVNNSSQPIQNNVAPIQNPPPAPVDTGSEAPINNNSSNSSNSTVEPEKNQEATSTSPVTVMARVLNPEVRVGQTGLIAVVLSSSNVPMLEANLALRFNPSVIKITAVRDGGIMSFSGATAEFNYSDGGDTVIVNARRPSGAAPVAAFGQLALVYFQAIGAGSADLNLSEAQLIGANGQSLLVTLVNSNVEVKADTPPNTGGNDGTVDDEEDDEDDE